MGRVCAPSRYRLQREQHGMSPLPSEWRASRMRSPDGAKLCVTETTFYRWKKQYTGLDISELRELKQLREEYRQLKQVVADPMLDKTILRDALGKNGKPISEPRGRGLGAGRLPPGRAASVSRPHRTSGFIGR